MLKKYKDSPVICKYNKFLLTEEIPLSSVISSKKVLKYFNRETRCAILTFHELVESCGMDLSLTPLVYSTGSLEFQNYGLEYICRDSKSPSGKYSSSLFIEKGLSQISPLNQFKILSNMPLCFLSMEFGLNGENAAVYDRGSSMLEVSVTMPGNEVIMGAGKIQQDGKVETGFAYLDKSCLEDVCKKYKTLPAIEIFKRMCEDG